MSDADPPKRPPPAPDLPVPSDQPDIQRPLTPKRGGKGFKKGPRARFTSNKLNALDKTYSVSDIFVKYMLIESIARRAGVSKAVAEAILDAFFDTLVAAEHAGETIEWTGLSVLKAVKMPASRVRNKRTGAMKDIQAHRLLIFRTSTTARQKLRRSDSSSARD